MKAILIQTMLLATAVCFGQPDLRFGFTANPLISWMNPEASEIEKGKVRGGIEYGFITDINFSENYILATGITVTLSGGNLVYTNSVLMRNSTDTLFAGDVNARFKLHYINLPVVFKMRTNQIGKFRYYGGLGLVMSFRYKARVDAEANGVQIFENDNIVKNKDQTDGVFESLIFDLALHVEGGIEYPFSEKTALVAGVFYRNGFVNVLSDFNEDKISLNNLGLRIGVLF